MAKFRYHCGSMCLLLTVQLAGLPCAEVKKVFTFSFVSARMLPRGCGGSFEPIPTPLRLRAALGPVRRAAAGPWRAPTYRGIRADRVSPQGGTQRQLAARNEGGIRDEWTDLARQDERARDQEPTAGKEQESRQTKTSVAPGTLYIVATPIGNLGDITLRAIEVLQGVDVIASEDTRRTSRLLQHLQLPFTKLISHHEHNWRSSTPEIVAMASSGKAIALVSDAGTPGICDPGMQLVQACIHAGVRVEPIPGACAAAAAVSVSAMAAQGFAFMGFIPHKGNQRQKVLGQIASSLLPVVVYEAPHRVLQTLEDLGKVLTSDRPVLVARELTKLHEQLLHVRLSEAIEHFRAAPPKGEFTFVIAPESGAADGGGGTAAAGDSVGKMTAVEKQACALLQVLLEEGISASTASKAVQSALGLKKNQVKQLATMLVRQRDEN